MGIKKDKSSSAAAVNSLRAAASYPRGVNVVCFEFCIIKCTSCDSHTVYPAYNVYHMSTYQIINISYPLSYPNRRSIYRLLVDVSDF